MNVLRLSLDGRQRDQALPQVFVEKFDSAGPCQFGGHLVITRRHVVVEAVLLAHVHVQRIQLVVYRPAPAALRYGAPIALKVFTTSA
jgi:hypothetical protein